MRYLLVVAAIGWAAGGAYAQQAAPLKPVELRCEYQVSPAAVGTLSPRFSWEIAAAPSDRGVTQTAYQILAASSPEALAHDAADLWDTGKVNSDRTLQVEYAGKPLGSARRVYWKVKTWNSAGGAAAETPWSDAATFAMGLLEPSDWHARWIGFPGDDGDKQSRPSPIFRKEFSVDKPIARATAYVCGLGQYEMTLNGKVAGDTVLGPAWTSFAKSCDYDTVDVTALLKPGANVVGIMLGNGMYNVLDFRGPPPGNERLRYSKFAGSLGVLKAIAQLEIEYSDGSHQTLGTDATWKTVRGPVTFSHAYGGEDYDARLEMPGWDSAGFNDAAWMPAVELPAPGNAQAKLAPAVAPPIRVTRTYAPVKITHPRPNMFVYDFGQNLSGWPKLSVQGKAGAVVKMWPGELLAADGTVSQQTFHGPTWLSYTLKGGGVEEWRPRFATQGFRYVGVEGAAPADEGDATLPRVLALHSEFVHADVRTVGDFSSSDDTLNRIHSLINFAILSNTQSVLTDCPHREKLGWLEQSHLMADAIAMNYDIAALYTKICRDMRDTQTPDGLVPNIAPEYVVFKDNFRDSPEWGSAVVINPWFLYRTYGDTRILRTEYDTMKRYVAYLGKKSTGHIVSHGLGDWFDVGPKKPGVAQLTTQPLTATAMYFHDVEILRRTAEVLHEDADAQKYAAIGKEIRTAFNARFFSEAGYEKGSQTANAMPLAMGLVDEKDRRAVLEKLADTVKTNAFHVTAGDVGFLYVVRALTDGDRGDVLLRMLLQSDGPGYVEQLKKGATTLTEAWDAAPNSQNHLMLGHGESWLYRGLAGIRNEPDAATQPSADRQGAVAFKHFIIAPQIVGDLAAARADFHAPSGLIQSAWTRDGTKATLRVTVPPNTSARVYIAMADADRLTEGGNRITTGTVAGVNIVAMEAQRAVLDVRSGHYVFETVLPAK